MRLQLNLNQYYEGLDRMQVNTLFPLFVNAQYPLKSVEWMLKKQKEENTELDDIYRTYFPLSKREAGPYWRESTNICGRSAGKRSSPA